jgi:hypothetical protein
MSRARDLADSADKDIAGTLTLDGLSVDGNIAVTGTVDGRDIASDGTKLDGVESGADVTDITNVTAAGALMDSELTSITAVKALNQGVATTDSPTFVNTTSDIDLTAISASIDDTAVDVFVYDTRKDSDGGAWRKRTHHTSWYNETLNTATRGSRKEFPAVAVIVAESSQVTIYDGDDPSLPMWMVFNRGGTWNTSNNVLFSTDGGVTSISMMNGLLTIGLGSYGLISVGYIEDNMTIRHISTYRPKYCGGFIAGRNDGNGSGAEASSFYTLVNSTINDIALTVLPNAPIDSATGLPVPTIAVATDGGVSVIKDDGTVVDITTASTNNNAKEISFDADNNVWFVSQNSGGLTQYYGYYKGAIPSSDISYTPLISYRVDDVGVPALGTEVVTSVSSTINKAVSTASSQVIATPYCLTLLDENTTTPSEGSVAYITSSYNTGWMNGDIKLATLSDTDDTDVTATNLISNSTFADSSGWSLDADGNWTISGGTLNSAGTGTPSFAWPSYSFDYGKQYIIQFDISSYTSGTLQLSSSTGGATHSVPQATGTYSFSFTVTGNQILYFLSNAFVGSVDNVYFYEAEEDRSVNGNGLQVFGTVTKNPVATGADLVAYSGFSASNYLVQPYNSDLDFGGDPFSISFWIKTTNTSNTNVAFSWRPTNGNTPYAQVYFSDATINFDISDGVNNGGITFSSPTVGDDSWHLITWNHRSSSLRDVYIDGKYVTQNTTSMNPLNASDNTFKIGGHWDTNYPFLGSLALFRVSKTALTAEQIAKIYEDEKVLFQENAQATLYGSSDAVTALAYDDDTELLHVGTSAGRSDFSGLRRVSNTIDAVGAAISASNGLIAED